MAWATACRLTMLPVTSWAPPTQVTRATRPPRRPERRRGAAGGAGLLAAGAGWLAAPTPGVGVAAGEAEAAHVVAQRVAGLLELSEQCLG